MKLLVLQTLVLSALATMDGGYGADKKMAYGDGKDKNPQGNGLALGQVANGQAQDGKKDYKMMYGDGKDKGVQANGLASGQVANGQAQGEKKDGKMMYGDGKDAGKSMDKVNGLNAAMMDEEKKKQMGEMATPDLMVIKANWADGKGEMQMNPPSPGGKIITVIVGGNELIYAPDTVAAAVGDKINFVFMAKNHTVTQSTFDKPCVKNPQGVDSGFMPYDGTQNPPPSFMFEVKTMAPTWFYCKQRTGTHCGKGMVFSINPTAEKTFGKFKEMAIQQNGTAVASGTTTPPPGVTMTTTTASVANAGAGAATTPPTTTAIVAPTPVNPSPNVNGVVQGTGKVDGAGSCDCTCMCGVAAFPPGAGVGNWGGYGGAMPVQLGSMPAAPPGAAKAAY
ncbi:MAG: hypothetical protein M1823_000583 [Watsoniomyces obsoletus]|nr:MAG: hypothetical protein M1823_000583 [Watsoniomyces obsoletus]